MKRILVGQILLVICCIFYLVWWYRGYRPGVVVSRTGGVNGVLLLATAAFGVAGLICSLTRVQATVEYKIGPMLIVIGGIALYFALLLITRFAFRRVVTTELFLIVGWIMLEMTVINRLHAAEILTEGLVLQDATVWKNFPEQEIIPENNASELYFEEINIEGFVKKLEMLYPDTRYVNRLMTHSWGQTVVRFYDPDGNLIEVGTPMR